MASPVDRQTAFVIAARQNDVARMHAIALTGIDLAVAAMDEETVSNDPITALQAAVVRLSQKNASLTLFCIVV
jgi:hypothetical protein